MFMFFTVEMKMYLSPTVVLGLQTDEPAGTRSVNLRDTVPKE